MAQYALNWESVTAVAVAVTTSFTDNGYPFFLQGGSSTQRIKITELYIGGESTASAPTTFKFARDSTVGATGISGNFLALTDPSSSAPSSVPVHGRVSTTKPQRSSTLHLLTPSFNCYGGVMRWVAHPDHAMAVLGNTASFGEASLSSVTGTGVSSGHCQMEVA